MTVVEQSDTAVAVLYANITMAGHGYSGNTSLNSSLLGYSRLDTSSPRPSCILFLFILFTIVTGSLCVLGFIGNVISMIVLQKGRGGRLHAATFLLQALAVADNCVLGMSFIFLCIIFGLLPLLNAGELRGRMVPYITNYIQPIAQMAQTATVWMTVLLAVNRYIAICRPFDTHRLASLKKTKLQVAFVFAFAFVLNFPRFFQYTIEHTWNDRFNTTMPVLRATSIGTRTLFGMVYTTWLYTIIVLLLPLILLIILNSRLILELRKMSKKRDSINQNERRSEENITLVMIIIILVFIVCNTPDRVNELVKYFKKHPMCSGWFYFDCVSQFFVVANSSTNFLVYYIFRRRFRQVLFQKLCFKSCGVPEVEEFGMNGQSNCTDHRQAVTLLSTNGVTCQSNGGDMQTVL